MNTTQEQTGKSNLIKLVDVPYFGDSRDVALIQLADVASFFLRRYAEIRENLVPPKFPDEADRVAEWIELFTSRSIGSSMMYPKNARSPSEDLFYQNASESLRML